MMVLKCLTTHHVRSLRKGSSVEDGVIDKGSYHDWSSPFLNPPRETERRAYADPDRMSYSSTIIILSFLSRTEPPCSAAPPSRCHFNCLLTAFSALYGIRVSKKAGTPYCFSASGKKCPRFICKGTMKQSGDSDNLRNGTSR